MREVRARSSAGSPDGGGGVNRVDMSDAWMLRGTRVSADVLALALGFGATFAARDWSIRHAVLEGTPVAVGTHALVALMFAGIALLVFRRLGLYTPRASVLNLWELKTAVKGMTLAAAYLFAILFLGRFTGVSRLVIVGAIVVSTVLVVGVRLLLAALIHRLQRSGGPGRKVLIFGTGPTGRLLMKKIVQSPQLGWTVVGFLDDTVPIGTRLACRVAQTQAAPFEAFVLGRCGQWRDFVAASGANELLICCPLESERMHEVLQAARTLSIRVGIVPQVQDARIDLFDVEDVSAVPVFRPLRPSARRSYHVAKRSVDVVLASLMLALSAPLWLLIGALIWLEDRGPVLFRQRRIGLGGAPFEMFKFRSMRLDAPAYAPSPHGREDARVTRVGRLLRMTGLDELPQLVNVLRGEMSLVGPRPEMPFIVDRYTALERQRLEVKPGLTGLWQLSADRHAEIHHNLEYDLYYINHRSIVLDALILLQTAIFTFGLVLQLPFRKSRAPGQFGSESVIPDEPSTTFSVLVAMEQRRTGSTPTSWQTLIPLATSLAQRLPVRILVTHESVADMDRLVEETLASRTTAGARPEYAIYRSRDQVNSLVRDAIVVVTDLPHVADWAGGADAGVAFFDGGTLELRRGGRCEESLLQLISELTLPSPPPLFHEPQPLHEPRPHAHLNGDRPPKLREAEATPRPPRLEFEVGT